MQGLLYFPENDGRSRKAETGGKVEWQNFNIEVELDWMDEEAYSIDDELRERIGGGRGKRPSREKGNE